MLVLFLVMYITISWYGKNYGDVLEWLVFTHGFLWKRCYKINLYWNAGLIIVIIIYH